MIYQVQSTSVYGGTVTWQYDNEHDAKCKVRELKDLGGMFIVRLIEIPIEQQVV
jgi:hypothetical protein|tara:strand:- start:1434 stop:1595 length:162 start_codon:yes stop_codon:yes gene_type:complete